MKCHIEINKNVCLETAGAAYISFETVECSESTTILQKIFGQVLKEKKIGILLYRLKDLKLLFVEVLPPILSLVILRDTFVAPYFCKKF